MQKIVEIFYNNNKYSIREVAKIFNISKSTIHRWININNLNKSLKEFKINYDKNIDETINTIINDDPFVMLKNVKNILEKKLSMNMSITGVYKHVKRNGFSFKKVSRRMYRNINEIKNKIKEFRKIIKTIKLSDVVCLDESGIKEDMCENYGWRKKNN